MKMQYKLRKNVIENFLDKVLVASAKIPELKWSILPSSFYEQLADC